MATDAGLTPAAAPPLPAAQPTPPLVLPGTPPMVNVRHLALIFLLFMPGISTAFLSLAPIAAFLLLTIMRGTVRRPLVILIVGLLTLSLVVILLRDITGVASVNARDLTEVIRLLALISTVALVLADSDAQFVRRLLMALLIADLVISLSQLQILPSAIAGTFSRFYHSDLHVESALGVSNRALGLFTDPTTHGLAMGLVALVFLSDSVARKGLLSSFGLVTALILVALAQSQTAFIAVSVGIAIFFFCILINRLTLRGLVMLGAMFGGGTALLLYFAEKLSYLFLLFRLGLGRNSYQRRVQKLEDSIEIMHDTPIGILLGWGKEYLGSTSAALDNEYLFVYLTYGLPGLVLFLGLLASIAVYAIYTKSFELLAATIIGLIAAYPASFFTNLKTFTLYCLVVSATIATSKLPLFRARLR